MNIGGVCPSRMPDVEEWRARRHWDTCLHEGAHAVLEGGVPFSVVATIMGWTPSTAARMARRYGHVGQAAQREAVNRLNGADSATGGAQNWAQFQANRFVASTNSLEGLAPRPGVESTVRFPCLFDASFVRVL
jgi:hypothetical protein